MRVSSMLLGGALCTVIGVVFVGVAANALLEQRELSRGATAVKGTVVRLAGSADGWTPVVAYPTPSGERELTGTVSSSPASYSVGEQVQVLYRPDTGAAVIDAFVDRYLLPTIFGGLGSVSLVVGIALLWVKAARWRKARTAPLPLTLAQSADIARSLTDDASTALPPGGGTSTSLMLTLVFLPMGVAFLGGGAWALSSTRAFLARTVEAGSGRIVDEHQWPDGTHTPVVEYRRRDGTSGRFEPDLSSWRLGDEVPVRYVDAPPYEARVDRFMELWFLPVLFSGLGAAFTLVGGATLVTWLRGRSRPRLVTGR